ncbi:hypothetical protein ASPCADRAFT_212316 [Aspergillus carbonarius ITEM 5010]|uniref:Uncharacterized protein n=1 Tax=Aspergillus carbonarius (strain ITEM 5010) TaxID=602072 RepID=A0A1R3R683_ASPC5|nr:hypothetical protein ASPCADRAFT_212316 [Aspergillus carbonarius ITEM 5010]
MRTISGGRRRFGESTIRAVPAGRARKRGGVRPAAPVRANLHPLQRMDVFTC